MAEIPRTFNDPIESDRSMNLSGKTILITGGTSGIGRALVERLAPCNPTVIVLGRNAVNLSCLVDEFDNVRTYRCDLEDGRELKNTISAIIGSFPTVSVVINNAGIQETERLTDHDFRLTSIEAEIAINLTAPIKICALMLKPMVSRGSSAAFVNITSGLALFPKTSSAVYCATKAALHSFSISLRYQLEGTSVSVHEAILPLVDTPMTEGRGKGKLSSAAVAKQIIGGVETGKSEIYVGKTKLIPILSRISPMLMASIMKSN